MKVKQNLKVRIDADAMQRIWHWTDLAAGEFSCLATVTQDVLVGGVQLFDQVCTSASTELDQQALAKFLCTHKEPENVRAWIHSHGKLGVFWSQQDEACIEGLANDQCLVSIVVNKKREFKARIDLWQPFRLTFDDLPLEIVLPDQSLRSECELLFNAHVVEMAPLVHMPNMQNWRRGGVQQPSQGQLQHAAPGYHGWPDFDDEDYADWR